PQREIAQDGEADHEGEQHRLEPEGRHVHGTAGPVAHETTPWAEPEVLRTRGPVAGEKRSPVRTLVRLNREPIRPRCEAQRGRLTPGGAGSPVSGRPRSCPPLGCAAATLRESDRPLRLPT